MPAAEPDTIWGRPQPDLLFEISDNCLTAIPDVDSFDANDLRSTAPQATQRLDQDCERARQSTCRRRCRQDVAITTMSTTEPAEDDHAGSGHLDDYRALGFAPRLLAFDHSQRSIQGGLGQSTVRQSRGGLELKQSRVDEIRWGAAASGRQPVEPGLVIAIRWKGLGNFAVDPLQFDPDAGFLPHDGRWVLTLDEAHHFSSFP
jgi:hypothetical protein